MSASESAPLNGLYLTAAGTRARTEGSSMELAFERELEAMLGHDRYERLRKVLLEARPVLAEAAAAPAPPTPTKKKPRAR